MNRKWNTFFIKYIFLDILHPCTEATPIILLSMVPTKAIYCKLRWLWPLFEVPIDNIGKCSKSPQAVQKLYRLFTLSLLSIAPALPGLWYWNWYLFVTGVSVSVRMWVVCYQQWYTLWMGTCYYRLLSYCDLKIIGGSSVGDTDF